MGYSCPQRDKEPMKKSKTTKKTSKKAIKIATPKKLYKTSELKKQASIIEELPSLVEMQKFAMMDFEDVYMVFDTLYTAFHAKSDREEGDVDSRFLALWTLFLHSVNWTEEQFWDTLDNHEHTCADCRKEIDEVKGAKKETAKDTSTIEDDEEEIEVITPKIVSSNKQFN